MKFKLCALVFCLSFLNLGLGMTVKEKKVHNQEKHHLSRHKERLLKTRDFDNNSSVCLSVDQNLLSLIKWLNNTRELELISELTPPIVRRTILGNVLNTTQSNGTIPAEVLDALYIPQEEFKIFLYFARVFGYVASRSAGNLVNLGQKLIEAFLRGSGNPQDLLKIFENLVNSTASSGNFLGNGLVPSPNIINGIENVEHAIEGGVQAIFTNIPSFG